jgi:phenylalanyl-tRNA synthetase beta chain
MISVANSEPDLCPLYTARIIRGVRVGPSPAWLQECLLARGDIPRNNIVDASNFVLFELGQPTHVFDLAALKGEKIIIRKAKPREPFLPIGEGAGDIRLHEHDLVIADAERAVAVAGVKGGALTAVAPTTRDILIEAATFSPAAVRATARRLGITSDSHYRFERGVSAGQVNFAATRLVELILGLCGGELCEGTVSDGQPIPAQWKISMRCDRCRAILGCTLANERMQQILDRLDLQPRLEGGVIHCTVPHARLDLEREIDLIEEVARIHGLSNVPVAETIEIRVVAPQPAELASRAVNDALVGMGYMETVTHSLVSEQAAAAFLPPGMKALRIDDDRAAAEPVLRPSIIPSLLRVLAHNRDKGTNDVRLFETASTFALMNEAHIERVNLALVAPADGNDALREVRGAIDRLAQVVIGPQASVRAEPQQVIPWFAPGAVLRVGESILGLCGVIAPDVTRSFGLDVPVIGAEIGLPEHYCRYPPETEAVAPPAFPAIERDVSAIVNDRVSWARVRDAVRALGLEDCKSVDFVTVFRGKQIGIGKKSLTLRVLFRAADRTLTNQEVEPHMQRVMTMLKKEFDAEIRR